jgi:hypothetical protein
MLLINFSYRKNDGFSGMVFCITKNLKTLGTGFIFFYLRLKKVFLVLGV